MMTPMYFSNNGSSEDSEEDFNIKPSMVRKRQDWQKKTLKPFIKSQKKGRGKLALLMERQNSYLSITTATSATTATSSSSNHDLVDLALHHEHRVLEAEDGGLNLAKMLTAMTPLKTETIAGAGDSNLPSSDDDVSMNAITPSIDCLEVASDVDKSEPYHEDPNDKNDVKNHDDNDAAIIKSENDMSTTQTLKIAPRYQESVNNIEPISSVAVWISETEINSTSALDSPSIADASVAENSTKADSDFTTLSSNVSSKDDFLADANQTMDTISDIDSESSTGHAASSIIAEGDVKVAENSFDEGSADSTIRSKPSTEQDVSSIEKFSDANLADESATNSKPSTEQTPASTEDIEVSEKSLAGESAFIFVAAKDLIEQLDSPNGDDIKASDRNESFITNEQDPCPVLDDMIVSENSIATDSTNTTINSNALIGSFITDPYPVLDDMVVSENSIATDTTNTTITNEQDPFPVLDDVIVSENTIATDTTNTILVEPASSPVSNNIEGSQSTESAIGAKTPAAPAATISESDKSSPEESSKALAEETDNPKRISGHGSTRSKRSSRSSGSHRSSRSSGSRRSSQRREHKSPRRDDVSQSRYRKKPPSKDSKSPSKSSSSISRKASVEQVDSQVVVEKVFEKGATEEPTNDTIGVEIGPALVTISEKEESMPEVLDISATYNEPSCIEPKATDTIQELLSATVQTEPVPSLVDEDEEEHGIFEDVEVATLPISPISPVSPVSPTSNNVRQLEYVDVSLGPSSRTVFSKCPSVPTSPSLTNVLSKTPNQHFYSIPHKKQGDEEAQIVPAPESVKLQSAEHVGETSTACESSDIAGDSDGDGSYNNPDESFTKAPEAPKKPVEAEGTASRSKSLVMVFFAFVLAALVGITLPFFVDSTVSAGAIIETASPSVSMVPSSTPSISQAPSDAPSSNPSIHPTISSMPTIAPSGQPTVSSVPTMAPTLSHAPTPAPSIVPTKSIEPSEYPSQVPSASPSSNPTESPSSSPTVSHAPSSSPSSTPSVSPSARPTQVPTMTFRPSSHPSPQPTRRPTRPPTPSPTRRPTPPPADIANAFKIRLYWSPDYFWQETRAETWWCMECVKCAEYGGKDGVDHGCNSYGTGDEGRCQAGDSIWIRDCRSRGNRFNVERSADNRNMLRIANTNLCIERIRDNHPNLYLQGCDKHNPYQRFNSWSNNDKFELRPPGSNDCVSQAHHPKSTELLAMHNCVLAQRDETLFWESY